MAAWKADTRTYEARDGALKLSLGTANLFAAHGRLAGVAPGPSGKFL